VVAKDTTKMDSSSLPQPRNDVDPQAGVAGAATCRPSGTAATGIPGTQNQAEGRQLPPPLEPPPKLPTTWNLELRAAVEAHRERCRAISARLDANPGHLQAPADLGAWRSRLSAGEAPEGPSTIVHEGGTIRHLLSGPTRTQLVLTAGTEPLIPPAQRGFDALWYAPPAVAPAESANVNVGSTEEPDPSERPHEDPAPGPAQAPLPLPRPWLDLDGPLLDLAHGAEFEVPDYGDAPKAQRGERFESPGEYLRALAACWSYGVRCFEHYGAPAGMVEYARKRAEKVSDCGTRWGNVWQCGTCGHVDKSHAVNLTKCESRMCPFCAKQRRGRWVAPMFDYVKRYQVKPRTAESKGHLSRDYYTDTLTDVKLPTVSMRGLRASVTTIKKKWPKVAKLASYLPRDKDWPDAQAWADAKVRFAAEMEAAKALPPEERATEQARIRTERSALWKRHQHKWPGECEEFGMLATIDMDTEAFVHSHSIRYGAWVWADDMREVCGGTWTRITPVRPKQRKGHMETQEEAQAHAIFETIKYPVKVTAKSGSNYYVPPFLAMLFEAATCGMRLTEGYGTMRGLVPDDDAGEGGEEDEKVEEPTECPKCGGRALTAVVLTLALGAWARPRPVKVKQCWCPHKPELVKVRVAGAGSELVEVPVERLAEMFKGRGPPGGGAT